MGGLDAFADALKGVVRYAGNHATLVVWGGLR